MRGLNLFCSVAVVTWFRKAHLLEVQPHIDYGGWASVILIRIAQFKTVGELAGARICFGAKHTVPNCVVNFDQTAHYTNRKIQLLERETLFVS